MDKACSLDQALSNVRDGATIMLGGFLGVGAPFKCIEKLVEMKVKDLTVICIVTTQPGGDYDMAPLFANKQVKKVITSHVGTSPEVVAALKALEIEQEVYPMGNLMEKIRCAGFGLGGALTPIGLDTLLERGKEIQVIDGKRYLLELPLRADFAFIKGMRADKMGNVEYDGVSINSNMVMAPAADVTIAEVHEIVEIGELDPMRVGTMGIFVNSVVQSYTWQELQKKQEEMWDARGRLAS